MVQQWLLHMGEPKNPRIAHKVGCFSNLNLVPKPWKIPHLRSVLEAQRSWF